VNWVAALATLALARAMTPTATVWLDFATDVSMRSVATP
jgi:hypothetical protein